MRVIGSNRDEEHPAGGHAGQCDNFADRKGRPVDCREFNVLRSSCDPGSGVISTRRLIVGSKCHDLWDATNADRPAGTVGRNWDRHNAIGCSASAVWLFKVTAIARTATWIAYPGVIVPRLIGVIVVGLPLIGFESAT